MEKIVCAALRMDQSKVYILGPRHFDHTMHMQIAARDISFDWSLAEQGFINQRGEFLTREQAYIVASAANQIIKKTGNLNSRKLYSEDIY